jgi:hypothetical protein
MMRKAFFQVGEEIIAFAKGFQSSEFMAVPSARQPGAPAPNSALVSGDTP